VKKIQALAAYKNIKAIWLENNVIEEIKGLETMKELTTLYLHHNQIREIGTRLSQNSNLVILNLSHNRLKKIENITELTQLKTLDISHNLLTDIADCTELLSLPKLTSLDIRDNQIDTHKEIMPFFMRMEHISALYLAGNPCVRLMSHYRREFILNLPSLYYLDEKPITENERNIALGFQQGGVEG